LRITMGILLQFFVNNVLYYFEVLLRVLFLEILLM